MRSSQPEVAVGFFGPLVLDDPAVDSFQLERRRKPDVKPRRANQDIDFVQRSIVGHKPFGVDVVDLVEDSRDVGLHQSLEVSIARSQTSTACAICQQKNGSIMSIGAWVYLEPTSG